MNHTVLDALSRRYTQPGASGWDAVIDDPDLPHGYPILVIGTPSRLTVWRCGSDRTANFRSEYTWDGEWRTRAAVLSLALVESILARAARP